MSQAEEYELNILASHSCTICSLMIRTYKSATQQAMTKEQKAGYIKAYITK